jgi:hypothetical protein
MATIISDDQDSNAQEISLPYSPSWVDRFSGWVKGLPWPSWATYLAIGIFLLFVQALIVWVEGALQLGSIDIAQVYLAAAVAFMLALIPFLDNRAGLAFQAIRPVLNLNDDEYPRLFYELTTLPSRATLLASLAALIFVFVTEAISEPYSLKELETFTVSANFLRFVYLLSWFVFGTFLYHTIHQLSVINTIYTKYARVDLLRVKPLYAFSKIAALTAGSVTVLGYGWLLLANPWMDRSDPIVFITMVILTLIAIVTFLWPQLGIHGLQVAEKERLVGEVNLRLESLISEFHQQIDDRDLSGLADLNTAMAGLETELNRLRKTPTWPWEQEVVRVLVTALALPLGLWLIQRILERIIGP